MTHKNINFRLPKLGKGRLLMDPYTVDCNFPFVYNMTSMTEVGAVFHF